MSVETHRVLMGACGWKHKAWLNDFYSEDLPEEWQLGFYANEFPVVYVPASDWLDTSASDDRERDAIDVAEWTEDVSDSFRFILEIPADVLANEQQFVSAINKVKILESSCLGLVMQLNQAICDEVQLLQKHLSLAQALVPVCIDKCDITLTNEIKSLFLKNKVNLVWNGESQQDENLECGSLAINHVSGDKMDMASLRKVVEDSLSKSSEECISVLCLDGNPPSLETLRNAEIILNLL